MKRDRRQAELSTRDAAVLALRRAGIGPTVIHRLDASNVHITNSGTMYVELQKGRSQTMFRLSMSEGGALLEHIEAERCWGEEVPLFQNQDGARLSFWALYKVLRKRT